MIKKKYNQNDTLIDTLNSIANFRDKKADDYLLKKSEYIHGGWSGLYKWFKSEEKPTVRITEDAINLLMEFLGTYQNKEYFLFRFTLKWAIDGNHNKTQNIIDSVLFQIFCNGYNRGTKYMNSKEKDIRSAQERYEYADIYINGVISKFQKGSNRYWIRSFYLGQILGASWEAKAIDREKDSLKIINVKINPQENNTTNKTINNNEYHFGQDKTQGQIEPVLLTIYGIDKEKLIEVHDKCVKLKLIRSNIDSWLHWFNGTQNSHPFQIDWLLKKSELLYFLDKLCPELELHPTRIKVINTIFSFIDGKPIDSHNKKTNTITLNTHIMDKIFYS
jgi:hypothetical protein